jgi:DNA-directed RNA polymerase subunit beta
MFFDPRKFDFSRVGRLKFNIKMGKPERERIDDPLLSRRTISTKSFLTSEDAQEPV